MKFEYIYKKPPANQTRYQFIEKHCKDKIEKPEKKESRSTYICLECQVTFCNKEQVTMCQRTDFANFRPANIYITRNEVIQQMKNVESDWFSVIIDRKIRLRKDRAKTEYV